VLTSSIDELWCHGLRRMAKRLDCRRSDCWRSTGGFELLPARRHYFLPYVS
jgi:hypothetical protein